MKSKKELVRKASDEVFNKHNLEAVPKFWKENYIQHNSLVKQGSKGFVEFFEGFINAFPNLGYEEFQIIAEENKVVVYGRFYGTMKNNWIGIRAKGQQIDFNTIDIYRIEDNKLAEHWDVMDLHTMFRQLE